MKCKKCNNDVIPYSIYMKLPYYKCDNCNFKFPDYDPFKVYDDLENSLNEYYDDCKFEILIISEDEIEVLYDNIKYMNDNYFIDNIFKIASNYLNEKDLWRLIVSYDVK